RQARQAAETKQTTAEASVPANINTGHVNTGHVNTGNVNTGNIQPNVPVPTLGAGAGAAPGSVPIADALVLR
ncbi:MAG: hypothetical protein ACOVLE_02235, partial [Pirellula staleyi]